MRLGRIARVVSATVAAALTAALIGCASIPTSGGVYAGAAIDSSDQEPFVFLPSGPADGASAEEILQGFVAAAVRPQGGYETARQFLAPDFADEWDPNAGVLLHESPNVTRDQGGGDLQLAVSVVASVDRSGTYVEYADTLTSPLAFEVEQIDGQWRITEAPSGVVMLRQTFERLYEQRTLYFYDPAFSSLVPDVRWFANGSDTSTRVVEALLAGPSPALTSPVLASAFPVGSALARPVSVGSEGIVAVELDESVLRAETLSQQRMKLQLTRSLIGGSIVSVTMQAGGVDIDVPDLGPDGPVLQPQVDPRAAVSIDGSFGWLSTGEIDPIDGLSAQIESLEPTSVALDASARRAAVGSANGVAYVNGGSDPLLVDPRGDLAPPALDSLGFAWSVPTNAPTALQVSDSVGAVSTVQSGWADLSSVVSIGVSRDGTRLLVYGISGGSPVLRVYGIVRDGDSRPVSLAESWFDLAPADGTPLSATWADETTVASLAGSETGDSRIQLQTVGGLSESLSRPDPSTLIVGANGANGLRVLSVEGELQALRGAGWQTTAEDVQYVANQR